MPKPFVLLVNGISATGKTTVARRLSAELKILYLGKDDVKEHLFDSLGWSDRAWSHKLSGATHAVLNPIIDDLLRCGQSVILDFNFNAILDPPKLRRWKEAYDCDIRQILCFAQGEVVFERFRERASSGVRHRGHCDDTNLEAFREYLLSGRCAPLEIEGPIFELDTTDFHAIPWADLLCFASP